MKHEFTPKLWTVLREEKLTRAQLLKDVSSGVTVGIVALPLAIAFAIASGVEPGQGLITAIVAGFIISALGGSRVQIGGPTGAFVIIVYGIIRDFGLTGLTIATVMAGVMMIAFGFLRLGNYLRYIPYPLIVGFTSGIAVLIFTTQLNDLFGLGMTDVPAEFFAKWKAYGAHFSGIHFPTLAIALFTMAVTLLVPRFIPRVPGSIIAIILATLAVALFNLPVETIGDRFGDFSAAFVFPRLEGQLTGDNLIRLLQPALAVALLGSIESLLSAVVADGMIGSRHRSNMELVAQGTANIFSALLGGIPATGALARTVTNIKNGGRTPIAGMVHAVTLLLILLILKPLAGLIPLSSLSGIMVIVAYNMSEWRQFRSLLKSNGVDVMILLVTFFLTVVFDLIVAIEVGLVLSSFLFMKRMGDSLSINKTSFKADQDWSVDDDLSDMKEVPPPSTDLMVYEVNGPLFFAAAGEFQDLITHGRDTPSTVIIRMRYVPFIDATGYQRLKTILGRFKERHVRVILTGVSPDLKKDFSRHAVFTIIPEGDVYGDFREALTSLGRG
jgi:SulP family sulfate permease